MVLTLKRWKSRTPPGIAAGVAGKVYPFTSQRADPRGQPFWRLCPRAVRWSSKLVRASQGQPAARSEGQLVDRERGSQGDGCRRRRLRQNGFIAGWSSPVARQAHNLKVVGSNPTPATNVSEQAAFGRLFCCQRYASPGCAGHVLHRGNALGCHKPATNLPRPRNMRPPPRLPCPTKHGIAHS
jgi:hypothetical protein